MILMYHKVHPDSPSMWWVDVNSFYRQMSEISYKKVVYLDDYDPSNSNHVVITFDGVYKNILEYAGLILQKFNYPFELFITSNFIGSDNDFDTVESPARFANEEELLELIRIGGRLQWHTRSHTNLGNISDKAKFSKELCIPDNLKTMDKSGFKWFAYPHGEFNDNLLEEVKKDFIGGVSCHQGNDKNFHCLNRVTVTNETSFRKAAITVIIASYNYGCYLVEAIESVFRQTRPVNEIIIADDCSTDNTSDIGKYYADRYPELVRYYRNDDNMGIVENFNKAVKMSNSEYVCILGADNRFSSNYIEETSAILDTDENIAIAYTDFALFGPKARLVWNTFPEKNKGPVSETYYIINFPDFDHQSVEMLYQNSNFIHGSSLYRKSAFVEVDGYYDEEHIPEDYNLFFRMIKSGWSAKRVPLPILEYRQHSNDQANIKLRSLTELNHYKKMNRTLSEQLAKTKDELLKHIELLQNKDAELIKHVALVKDKDDELIRNVSLLDQKKTELSQTVDTLQKITSTKSWRYTYPIRVISEYVTRLFVRCAFLPRRILSVFISVLRWCYHHFPAPATFKSRWKIRILNIVTSCFYDIDGEVKRISMLSENRFLGPDFKLLNTNGKFNNLTSNEHTPYLDLTVVTFNSSGWIQGFFDSLVHQKYPISKINLIIVDNQSTDDTVYKINDIQQKQCKNFSSFQLYRRRNLGYGNGHNYAIKKGSSPYLLVSNIDLEFEPDAIFNAVIMAESMGDDIASWEFRQKPYEHPKYYDPVTLETAWSSCACILFRRACFDKVRGFDKRIFMYGEDVELSFRLQDHGFKTVYCPKAVVWHYTYEEKYQVKPVQFAGSIFSNSYIRLRYGNLASRLIIPLMYFKLFLRRPSVPHQKRIVLKTVLKVMKNVPYLCASRKLSDKTFPFRDWDYEMQKDGAFYEYSSNGWKKELPLVSIITRTYKGRLPWLKQAVSSCLNQTYPNIEMVIVEDGSYESKDFVEKLSIQSGKKIVYKTPPKKGRSHAGNVGLAASSGEFLMFLDDDDLIFPDHVEVLIQELMRNKNKAAAYSLAWEVPTKINTLNPLSYQEMAFKTESVFRQPYSRAVLLEHNYIPIQAILFRRKLYERHGGFDTSMDYLEDWNLWSRYSHNEEFIYIEKTTSLFRTPYDPKVRAKRQEILNLAYKSALERNNVLR